MHRIAATPGGWTPDTEGFIVVEQSPAPIVILTAADTELQTLAGAIAGLPEGFPAVRATNLLQLQQQMSIDLYAESVLAQAQVIVLRLLGGRAYWPYGLEVCLETVRQTGASLIVLPGDDRSDPGLMGHSTLPLAAIDRVWNYLVEGGAENFRNGLLFLAATCLEAKYQPPPPQSIPRTGLYEYPAAADRDRLRVGVLFYRAHYLAGNTAAIDALCGALQAKGLAPIPVYVPSLRDPEVRAEVLEHLQGVCAIINTTGFSLAKLDTASPDVSFWEALGVPVLQAILSGGTQEQWAAQWRGLSPRDTAMNVALPEVDGRIISRAISFKAARSRHPQLETDIIGYEPACDRIDFVAELAANWTRLQQTPPSDRCV
ncbi:MAG: cobaltochelatase subunit CobN, partial [Cyanobacteria bacterium J06641_5]